MSGSHLVRTRLDAVSSNLLLAIGEVEVDIDEVIQG
jgi:hypothetical protein